MQIGATDWMQLKCITSLHNSRRNASHLLLIILWFCAEFGMWSSLWSGRQGNRVLSTAACRAGAWFRWHQGWEGGARVGRFVGQQMVWVSSLWQTVDAPLPVQQDGLHVVQKTQLLQRRVLQTSSLLARCRWDVYSSRRTVTATRLYLPHRFQCQLSKLRLLSSYPLSYYFFVRS